MSQDPLAWLGREETDAAEEEARQRLVVELAQRRLHRRADPRQFRWPAPRTIGVPLPLRALRAIRARLDEWWLRRDGRG